MCNYSVMDAVDCLIYEDEGLSLLARRYARQAGIQAHFFDMSKISSKKQLLTAYQSLTEKSYVLVFSGRGLQLCMLGKLPVQVSVDFCSPQMQYRVSKGGGKSQMIAKALGLKAGYYPRIVDATGGLGKDAFVLASLGCYVLMYERNPIIQLLLEDGLRRAQLKVKETSDRQLGHALERLDFRPSDILDLLNKKAFDFDALYLDPMFPHPEGRSLVKKDMQMLQSIVGSDSDASDIFERALSLAIPRLVVKRPKSAPYLLNKKPDHSFLGKRNRFDVYHLNY